MNKTNNQTINNILQTTISILQNIIDQDKPSIYKIMGARLAISCANKLLEDYHHNPKFNGGKII